MNIMSYTTNTVTINTTTKTNVTNIISAYNHLASNNSYKYVLQLLFNKWLACNIVIIYIYRSGYFAGHRLRYKNLFCRSLISSCCTLGLGLGFGLGYRRMMDVRVRVWIRI